jgi:hypothetical protein
MSENINNINPENEIPTIVELPASDNIKIINTSDISENSVVVIKIKTPDIQQRIAATQQIAMALKPVFGVLQSKNTSVIVMSTDETFEVLDESQMEKLGWIKKTHNLIITPR